MAKKGGAQQLQAEINTDEELFKFLEKPGLLVMDVYSEWCGPCQAMVGSLKKIKLEVGGDNLQLAICKADTIDVLERFRLKSEPTWLFATRGKLVNLMFGSDVPKLMQLITHELNILHSTKRTYYEIWELQPEERARRDKIEFALAEAKRKEAEEAAREKLEYLTFVTNEIMTNLPDMGVTIFGPHIGRETYKKLTEYADAQKMQCKDRRTGPIYPEHFDIINFACENPIDPEVLEHMYNKDLLICFWKTHEQDPRNLEDIFLAYTHELTQPRRPSLDFGDEAEALPPILSPLEIRIEKELEGTPEKEASKAEEVEEDDLLGDIMGDKIPGVEESEEGKDEEAEQGEDIPPEEEAPVVSNDCQIILVPPIWVPTDRRTHATLIYVFFRAQTAPFLPPDPVPDPPHLIMAFDAYKKRDIFEVVAKNKENVLLYGFFTNDNPQTAKLIASSIAKYEETVPQITDKIVLKVAKKTSHTMLAFAVYAPTFVSANTVVGQEEALHFFPEGFSNVEPVVQEPEVQTKKPAKKAKQADAEVANE